MVFTALAIQSRSSASSIVFGLSQR